jgi:hypothetical protein
MFAPDGAHARPKSRPVYECVRLTPRSLTRGSELKFRRSPKIFLWTLDKKVPEILWGMRVTLTLILLRSRQSGLHQRRLMKAAPSSVLTLPSYGLTC